MRTIALALMTVALAAPALAQPNLSADSVRVKTDVEVKQEQEREAGYKSGLDKIPDGKAKKDPWGNVRGTSAQTHTKSNSK